jgi:hypothetical protein
VEHHPRFRFTFYCATIAVLIAVTAIAKGPRPAISEDRELKEIDLKAWDCRDQLSGTAKTDEGIERNALKNRSVIDLTKLKTPSVETDGFLQMVAAFDKQTKGMKRPDLDPASRRALETLEKQIVSFTGYLVIAYAGPPETCNCGSSDFHDWHLELFEQPLDHAPEIGDPTPIICEISPRTQNAIFKDGTRIQALASFIRAPDMTIEPTDHPARRVRITGYLLWDDEHNGAADIGDTIRTTAANGFHQPWRSTAWEIHPAIKIEALDPTSPFPRLTPPTTGPSPTASDSSEAQIPTPASPPPTPQAQFVTTTAPIKIKIIYGETVIPRGTKLRVISHDAKNVTVSYMDGTYAIPISSTDFRE